MTVLVIDGQGGGIGCALIKAVKALNSDVYIKAAGTNAFASDKMLASGADASTVITDNISSLCDGSDIIAGPIGLIIAGSMKGEISESTAMKIAECDAGKVLIPLSKCNVLIAGSCSTLSQSVDDAAHIICSMYDERSKQIGKAKRS